MKIKTVFLSALALLMFAGQAMAKTINQDDKVLVVYYSKTGNTKVIAEQIRQLTGGDIVEIEPEKAYPDDYRQLTELAKKEISEGLKPALKTKVENFKDYDIVFVGSPCWWGTVASPVASFLSENDFTGKKVVPFMTHGGSGLGHSVADIKKIIPDASVIDGKAFWGNDVENAGEEVSVWVKGLQND